MSLWLLNNYFIELFFVNFDHIYCSVMRKGNTPTGTVCSIYLGLRGIIAQI